MAFNGNLIMVGSYVIPNKYIKYDSWKSTWETMDFDSYRDFNGDLHRNALANRKIKVEFQTPYMYKSDFDTLMAGIRSQFISDVEQSLNVSAYIDEKADYITQKCYMANTTPEIAQNSPLGIIYKPCRIAFIAY